MQRKLHVEVLLEGQPGLEGRGHTLVGATGEGLGGIRTLPRTVCVQQDDELVDGALADVFARRAERWQHQQAEQKAEDARANHREAPPRAGAGTILPRSRPGDRKPKRGDVWYRPRESTQPLSARPLREGVRLADEPWHAGAR